MLSIVREAPAPRPTPSWALRSVRLIRRHGWHTRGGLTGWLARRAFRSLVHALPPSDRAAVLHRATPGRNRLAGLMPHAHE